MSSGVCVKTGYIERLMAHSALFMGCKQAIFAVVRVEGLTMSMSVSYGVPTLRLAIYTGCPRSLRA